MPSGSEAGEGVAVAPTLMTDSRQRQLRKSPTLAEQRLWSRLRLRQVGGCKFRRQHPVGGYIADFACIERRLIIEADGGQHAVDPKDLIRTERLEALGWRVLRFWNNDILANLDGVVAVILDALDAIPAARPSPGSRCSPPSPTSGRGLDVPSPAGAGEGAERKRGG